MSQFVWNVCDIGEDFEVDDSAPSLDAACGAGTSDLDLGADDYVTIVNDAIALLEDSVEIVIPEDQIGTVCEVRKTTIVLRTNFLQICNTMGMLGCCSWPRK